jgi:DNA-directed RNA polymerase specialized sigma24 family protein
VRVLELPGQGKDVTEWLAAGGTKEKLLELADQAPVWKPSPAISYQELLSVFQKWLALPSEMPVRFVLCTVIANRLPGDPLWAFIVGPSGDGKTEIVNPLAGLDFVQPLDTLTVNTFLSGKQKKDPNASLLKRLPYGAILLMRDFTSVLEMHREKRDEIFSQLRKIYDGHLTRATGEGGESAELSWTGKVGLIACVTPAIEGYRAFATTLGERFLYYYLPTADRLTVAKAARRNRASLHTMRAELRQTTRRFFDSLQIPDAVEVPDEIGDWIVQAADFVSIARSAVERDWYSATKEITEIPDPEVPTRLSQQLDLLTCAHAVLMGRARVEAEDLALTREVALACIPSHRRKLIALLFQAGGRELTTTEIANEIDLPTNTVRRYLEDLTALRLVARREGDTNAFLWKLTDFAREGWVTLTRADTRGATQNPVPVLQKDLALQTSGYEYSNTPKSDGGEGGFCVGGDVCSATPKVASETEKSLAPRASDEPTEEELEAIECPF